MCPYINHAEQRFARLELSAEILRVHQSAPEGVQERRLGRVDREAGRRLEHCFADRRGRPPATQSTRRTRIPRTIGELRVQPEVRRTTARSEQLLLLVAPERVEFDVLVPSQVRRRANERRVGNAEERRAREGARRRRARRLRRVERWVRAQEQSQSALASACAHPTPHVEHETHEQSAREAHPEARD